MNPLQQKSILDFVSATTKQKKRRIEGDEDEHEDSLAETLLPLLTDIASIKPTVEDTNKVVKTLKKEQTALKQTVNANTKSIADLTTRMNVIDQRYYEAMMEISGIDADVLEATRNTLTSYTLGVIKKTSPNVNGSHVEFAYIRKLKVGQGEKSIIVVKFSSKSTRLTVMIDRRNAKLKDGIYFNEVLTSAGRKLLFEARKLRKEGKLLHVWTRDGAVCVRKNEEAPMKKILSITDLTAVFTNQPAEPGTNA